MAIPGLRVSGKKIPCGHGAWVPVSVATMEQRLAQYGASFHSDPSFWVSDGGPMCPIDPVAIVGEMAEVEYVNGMDGRKYLLLERDDYGWLFEWSDKPPMSALTKIGIGLGIAVIVVGGASMIYDASKRRRRRR